MRHSPGQRSQVVATARVDPGHMRVSARGDHPLESGGRDQRVSPSGGGDKDVTSVLEVVVSRPSVVVRKVDDELASTVAELWTIARTEAESPKDAGSRRLTPEAIQAALGRPDITAFVAVMTRNSVSRAATAASACLRAVISLI